MLKAEPLQLKAAGSTSQGRKSRQKPLSTAMMLAARNNPTECGTSPREHRCKAVQDVRWPLRSRKIIGGIGD